VFGRHAVCCERSALIIRSERDGCAHVIELVGELDMNTSHAFENELRRVEASDVKQILVDLGALKSVGADGLKILIHADARSRRAGNRLRLLGASGRVQKTFETTGLLSRLPFTGIAEAPHRNAPLEQHVLRAGQRQALARG
jgi:anti-anti-sigma factor